MLYPLLARQRALVLKPTTITKNARRVANREAVPTEGRQAGLTAPPPDNPASGYYLTCYTYMVQKRIRERTLSTAILAGYLSQNSD